MNDSQYTTETMEQIRTIYDKLERLSENKRFIVELMTESFIDGMKAQERLDAQALEVQESA